ncbi:hypothetical protein FBY33_2453 [Arthrobacter sp. SLBN-112]|uniref:hypothetical protein n=1 Tax=Arthrobacter sp. SLBN-112 TaxID=2768452 RepID=UPI001172ED29|nr:hypothetical protein [Arthrobacter sp. SLBN-112]TQJ40393.1 hypothetical protein FBY33_2453 [Arthrobacter sp. SLBN-112]
MPQAGPAVRLLTGFAGFGAGSLNLALSSSVFAASAGPAAPLAVFAGVVAGAWGLAMLAGAVVFLARERLAGGPWARWVLAGAAAIHLAAIAFTPVAPAASNLSLTHLSALLLTLTIIASLGWLQRAAVRQRGHGQDNERQLLPAAPAGAGVRPGRLLPAAFAGAVLVAGITTPGLAASTAGQYAVPHGGHNNLMPGGHHQR